MVESNDKNKSFDNKSTEAIEQAKSPPARRRMFLSRGHGLSRGYIMTGSRPVDGEKK